MNEKIEQIDKNFKIKEDAASGFEFFSPFESPFRIDGMPWGLDKKRFIRMPEEKLDELPYGVRCGAVDSSAGIRIQFRTDSPEIFLRGTTSGIPPMANMPRSGQSGVDIYLGPPEKNSFSSVIFPRIGETNFSRKIKLGPQAEEEMSEVTLNLPLYDTLKEFSIGFREKSRIAAPTPLARKGKIIVYGSSTIQGACVSHPGNGLTNRLSRSFNIDFVNLGFSGRGNGELIVAETIASLNDIELFILAPDANVSPEILQERLQPFVLALRKCHPQTPIIAMSRHRSADNELISESLRCDRSKVFQAEVCACKKNGDQNIHYLDGADVLGRDYKECTSDGCHMNDLGFMRMSKVLEQYISRLLK